MSPGDFLRKNAETQLCEHYIAAGAVCRFSTNCEYLLERARESFLPVNVPSILADFSVRFWVDHAYPAQPPWPKPYVRGLDHLVFAGFEAGSSMLADLRTRRVIGRFSAAMAADSVYWRSVVFPMMLTIVSASVGVAELHCACVAKDQDGLLLAGPSGSGKSTLALALGQMGYGFLSDDRTFCSVDNGRLQAWGLGTQLKLRPDAAQWFQELRNLEAVHTHGVRAFWLDPEQCAKLKRVRRCRPSSLIFLERHEVSKFQLSPMAPTEALDRLSTDLLGELPDAAGKRLKTIETLVELPCWLVEFGGQPYAIARQISHHLSRSRPSQKTSRWSRDLGESIQSQNDDTA